MSEGDIRIHLLLNLAGFTVNGYPALNDDDVDEDFPNINKSDASRISDRNKSLIVKADKIIALPQMMNEWEDSPQWKTIRYAISQGLEVYIITPIAGYIYKRV
jgi:hypothetical protein